VTEGLARVFELLTSTIAVGGARTLSGGVRAGVIILLAVIPDDLVIGMFLVSSEASLVRGQILRSLQSK
jgi:hypothetical protein